MDAIRTVLRRLCRSEEGATAIEYGLIVALIAVACIQAMSMLGGGSDGMWTRIGNSLTNAMSNP